MGPVIIQNLAQNLGLGWQIFYLFSLNPDLSWHGIFQYS
jgi:hypothetical protein